MTFFQNNREVGKFWPPVPSTFDLLVHLVAGVTYPLRVPPSGAAVSSHCQMTENLKVFINGCQKLPNITII
jgi:hypothetical protein